ncbi:hypothetical protein CLOM_g11698 [Closterium sp. NIES-68]|nr:hypothetical protein CLOM_g11698 [Closterium sp. NIES-68]GJP70321.1 hypothetical protein CLOP_g1268 [Closterium sp. NIES-67]
MARLLPIALLVLALSCACFTAEAKVYRDGTLQWTLITQALQKGGKHSTYLSIVNKAGMKKWITDYLSSSTTGFTCLVPSNAAFKTAKPATLKPYAKSATTLQDLVKFGMLNFQALPQRLAKDGVGQGYVTFSGKDRQIQKYQPVKAGAVTLGPQFAQQGYQLANITKILYKDPTAICYEIDNVLVPVK